MASDENSPDKNYKQTMMPIRSYNVKHNTGGENTKRRPILEDHLVAIGIGQSPTRPSRQLQMPLAQQKVMIVEE